MTNTNITNFRIFLVFCLTSWAFGCNIKCVKIFLIVALKVDQYNGPEYREKGAVREIFAELLPQSYKNGEVISALFPFNHEFYRKQGYEVVTFQNYYELKPALLNGYRFDGTITRWNPGEPVDDYLNIYNIFAADYNLAMHQLSSQFSPYNTFGYNYIFHYMVYVLIQYN